MYRYEEEIQRLSSTLETRYNIGTIGTANSLEGGYWNTLFRLNCTGGPFVLRISHPNTVAYNVVYEHALLRFMSARIPQVPAPLLGQDGSTYFQYEGRVISLYPFMPGRIPGRENEAVRTEAARMLARLHRAGLAYPDSSPRPDFPPLRDLNWNYHRLWDWSRLEALLSGEAESTTNATRRFHENIPPAVPLILARRHQIEQERGWFREWVTQLASSERPLLFAPTHGDYYPGNLLAEEDRISGVIDWDECQPEWLSYELGRAMWEFCKDKAAHTLDQAKAAHFLQAYQEAGGAVPPGEFDLLVPFMRCVRLIEILSHLGEASRGEMWDPDYTWHNLVSLENLKMVS
jgi:Ser/Thr protein kinase RdoA (MazF antagonist)